MSTALRKELNNWVGQNVLRPRVKAVLTMGRSAYATSSNETCSNQGSSILQRPFSSAYSADMIREMTAGKFGEKASDATGCRVH
jgi:hypothetical protein